MDDSMSSQERTYHPQLSCQDADIVLQSTDGVYYRLPTFLLRSTTKFFYTMLPPVSHSPRSPIASNAHPDPIPISSPSYILTPILLILSGLAPTPHAASGPLHFSSLAHLEEALALLNAWDAPGPICVIRASIMSYLSLHETLAQSHAISSEPAEEDTAAADSTTPPADAPGIPKEKGSVALRLFGLAVRMGWADEARRISRWTLGVNVWDEKYVDDLQAIESLGVMRLMKLRRRRRDMFKKLLDDATVGQKDLGAIAPPTAPSASSSTATESAAITLSVDACCSSCSALLSTGAPTAPYLLNELKSRMFWDMDRRPLGDSMLDSLEIDEWSEAMACWKLKCACGKEVFSRVEVVGKVRDALEMLPLTT